MANKPRTFVVSDPVMTGEDIREWQLTIQQLFKKMDIICPIVIDGVYGVSTRSYNAALCRANGMSAGAQMKNGITPNLRTRLRNGRLTAAQQTTKNSTSCRVFRANLRKQYAQKIPKTHAPAVPILQDSWGWHPGVHDGIDIITNPDPVIFAMVKCKIIDVRSSGWWGKGAPSDPGLKAKGDGIIQMEVLEDVGPFKKGMHIGYGHAEKALVKVGRVVEAGAPVGHAGFANAWHIHLMVNGGNTTKGIGDRDPLPFVNYAVKNG